MSAQVGAVLRMLRTDAGVTLGDLARAIGVSPAYLSRVEHGHDAVPTPDRLVAIARVLDLPPLVLLEIAQGAGTALASYLERVPEARSLFVEMARRELGAAEIGRIKAFMDRSLPAREARRARLADVLSPRHVIVRAMCQDVGDVIALAASRLSDDEPARDVAARVLEREELAPSFIGRGVIAPHAITGSGASRAALVVAGRGIRAKPPDGVAVRVGVVLLAPRADKHHLELLAHVARLAGRGLADALCDARTAEQALERLAALDVS
jgi:PTS system nitrogen regulatory IIA component